MQTCIEFYEIIISNIISAPLILLSWIVPKKKGLILFTSSDGSMFKDNPKYLFLYIFYNVKNLEPYWVSKSIKLCEELKNKNIPFTYVYSFLHFFKTLRAEYIVCDDTHNAVLYDSFFWFYGRFNNVLLWHGTGFKKIGLLDDKYLRKNNYFKKSITYFIQKRRYMSYCLISACSEMDRKRKMECFQNKNVFITGSPRNDLFFNKQLEENDIKKDLNLEQYDKVILYAPTYRENNQFNPFSDQFWMKMEKFLINKNYVFLVKKHSYDRSLKIPSCANIFDISSKISDVQEILGIADILISDYSSIVTDYALTDKPIIFYTYDYDQYLKSCRSFYFSMDEILPGPFVKNEDEILRFLDSLDWFYEKNYRNRFNSFKDFFYEFKDSESSQRVANLLSKH